MAKWKIGSEHKIRERNNFSCYFRSCERSLKFRELKNSLIHTTLRPCDLNDQTPFKLSDGMSQAEVNLLTFSALCNWSKKQLNTTEEYRQFSEKISSRGRYIILSKDEIFFFGDRLRRYRHRREYTEIKVSARKKIPIEFLK
jgi:hypothetical protein